MLIVPKPADVNEGAGAINMLIVPECAIPYFCRPIFIFVDGSTRSGEARKRACEDNYYI